MGSQLYESMFLMDAAVGEEGIPEAVRHITELLGRFDVRIERIEKWGERELCYPIGKTRNGLYLLFFFHADTEKVSDIRRVLNISEQVVRFIILGADGVPPVCGTVYDEQGNIVEMPGEDAEPDEIIAEEGADDETGDEEENEEEEEEEEEAATE